MEHPWNTVRLPRGITLWRVSWCGGVSVIGLLLRQGLAVPGMTWNKWSDSASQVLRFQLFTTMPADHNLREGGGCVSLKHICVFLHVWVSLYPMPQYAHEGQWRICATPFSPSTLWVPGSKLRFLDLKLPYSLSLILDPAFPLGQACKDLWNKWIKGVIAS